MGNAELLNLFQVTQYEDNRNAAYTELLRRLDRVTDLD